MDCGDQEYKVGEQYGEHIDVFSSSDLPHLNFIKPEPLQILTVYQDSAQNMPIHIDLDTGANVNYVSLSEAKKGDSQ